MVHIWNQVLLPASRIEFSGQEDAGEKTPHHMELWDLCDEPSRRQIVAWIIA